jgi:hypothetical protein
MRSIRQLLPTFFVICCYTQAFSPSTICLNKVETESSSSSNIEDSSPVEEGNLRDLPPVMQQIADERKDFQVNLGKAMDTIRKDMPDILKIAPDFSIYHDDITVIDPSGVQLTGIESYKQSIQFLQVRRTGLFFD